MKKVIEMDKGEKSKAKKGILKGKVIKKERGMIEKEQGSPESGTAKAKDKALAVLGAAKGLTQAISAASKVSWKSFVGRALEGGAGQAYTLTKRRPVEVVVGVVSFPQCGCGCHCLPP